MDNRSKGKYGEDLAVSYLEKQGHEILERNYRFGRGEIDIISLKEDELLVFTEVKNRKSSAFGEPETFVSENQQNLIYEAAEDYIQGINWQKDIRFDILAISKEEVEHFVDAF